jgi:hypothetical protein
MPRFRIGVLGVKNPLYPKALRTLYPILIEVRPAGAGLRLAKTASESDPIVLTPLQGDGLFLLFGQTIGGPFKREGSISWT